MTILRLQISPLMVANPFRESRMMFWENSQSRSTVSSFMFHVERISGVSKRRWLQR